MTTTDDQPTKAPRVAAVYAFLDALGLPTDDLHSFSASVTHDRNGDHVTVSYNLGGDNAFNSAAEEPSSR